MTRVAIVDTVCFSPYAASSLAAGALGGTESTVVRIAEALDAQVHQHNRVDVDGRYRPLADLVDADVLIVMRDPKAAFEWHERIPHARLFVWMHDLVERGRDRAKRLVAYRSRLGAAGATLVAVSDFHRAQLDAALADAPDRADGPRPATTRIYNPLAPGLASVAAAPADVDPDQLVFFSSPVKGLEFALFILPALRRRWPAMRLLVANPGYRRAALDGIDGVVDLGPLDQPAVLRHVARSLCAFCPNFEYPETFGLVLAESNAVGTPVLAHPVGAAAEVLGDPRQIVDLPTIASVAYRLCVKYGTGHAAASRAVDLVGGFSPFVERLAAWRDARPVVAARDAFALDAVVARWRTLLGLDMPAADVVAPNPSHRIAVP